VRPLKHADDIARRFFSPAETAEYFALQESDRALGFMNCWTRKEAFIKAAGEGLYMPLDSFDVSLTPGEDASLRSIADGDPNGWRIVSFHPFPDFLSAIVTKIGHAQASAA
jgi:4'-phosphopantetheinyl transferase